MTDTELPSEHLIPEPEIIVEPKNTKKPKTKRKPMTKAKQVKRDAAKALGDMFREQKHKIKAMHKKSGYFNKKKRYTVSGGTMSKK